MLNKLHQTKEFYLSPQYIVNDKKEKNFICKGALFLENNDSDNTFFQTAKFNDPMKKISVCREYFYKNNQEHSYFSKGHLVKDKKTSVSQINFLFQEIFILGEHQNY